MKTIKGNLILKEDTTFEEDIKVEGNIVCLNGKHNLTVKGNIDAWDIDAGNIDAWDIDARNIYAWDIDAWDIDAYNIDAWDIDAGNIDAWDIDAGKIDAWDIDARNINAGDINTYNIDAENIIYYAVCCSYNDIVCESIKGKRENSKHFCLDGKITIKEKVKYCNCCGAKLEEKEE